MKKTDTDGIYTKAELTTMLDKMEAASNAFYAAAFHIGNHPFIELTGFMNEYIKACRGALAEGRDFTVTNTHSGKPLMPLFHDYEAAYLGEKFGCIFETSFAGDKKLIRAFCREAFGVEIS